MPKSLGQIHQADFQMITSSNGDRFNLDLPGKLTEQLQTLVRCGTYHKVVGIDMNLTAVGTVGGGQVTGKILYYAPTRGRCEAFRNAFAAMKDQMKIQGINMHENKLYDFRAPLNSVGDNSFPNQATLDGETGLALYNVNNEGASIFGVHNKSVRPIVGDMEPGDLFAGGFNTLLDPEAATDFVLNDTALYTGNEMNASLDYQEIPFSLSYTRRS